MKGSEGAEREDIIDIVIARFSGRSGLVVFPSGKRVPLFTGLVLWNRADGKLDVALDVRGKVQARWAENTAGSNDGQEPRPKLRYFNFQQPAATVFTTGRDVVPKHQEKTWPDFISAQ